MPVAEGALSLGLVLSGTGTSSSHIEECPDIGPVCNTATPPPYRHVQRLYASDLTVDAAYGLHRLVGLEATLPLRQVTTTIRYTDLQGEATVPSPPDLHHRNETLIRPGDPWLLLHTGATFDKWGLSAKAGASIPLGQTVENPFPLGRMGLPHQHIQFGTGTVDPLVAASLQRRFDGWSTQAFALARLALYENSHHYRAGNRIFGGIGSTSALGTRNWQFTAGGDVYHESAEHWDGHLEDEGNLGRTDVLASVGFSVRVSAGWTLNTTVKVPVFVDAVGAQVSYPALLQLSASTTLGQAR